MKTKKMLTILQPQITQISQILVLALSLLVWLPKASEAAPIGTAFTYQGRLIDANNAADGLYDFQFKLFDANSGGNKLGADVNKPEVDVIDGYFTVELDFGSVFDGNDRWLEIGVRPGELGDPNVYTTLSPRQRVTPAPYALYAKKADSSGADSDWIISGNNMYSGVSGNVGIGTTNPGAKLEVAGQVKITGGSPGNGKVLTSDSGGLATWQTPATGGDNLGNHTATQNVKLNGFWLSGDGGSEGVYVANDGNVGIGATAPAEKLEVAGNAKVRGTGNGVIFPDGTKQTTAAGNEIYFSVKRSTTYDWPTNGAWLKIAFDTVWSNVGGDFNTVTSTFTAPIAGTYTFHGAINFTGLTAGDMMYVQIAVGGKYYCGEYKNASGSSEVIVSSITVHLNQGDTAQLYGYVAAASPPAHVYGNSSASYAFTYFDGARVY